MERRHIIYLYLVLMIVSAQSMIKIDRDGVTKVHFIYSPDFGLRVSAKVLLGKTCCSSLYSFGSSIHGSFIQIPPAVTVGVKP